MNFEFEHAFIAVLVLALLYYVSSHQSLLNDLSVVPHDNNPQLKAVKGKHLNGVCVFQEFCWNEALRFGKADESDYNTEKNKCELTFRPDICTYNRRCCGHR